MMGNKEDYKIYSTVEKQEVEWLWYPYIPYGKNDSEFSSKASCVRSTSGVHAF